MTVEQAFAEFIERNGLGIDPEDAEAFENAYRQEWESEEEFARYHVENVGWNGVPPILTHESPAGWETVRVYPFEVLAPILDWSAIAQALFRHGPYTFIQDDAHSSRGHVFEADV